MMLKLNEGRIEKGNEVITSHPRLLIKMRIGSNIQRCLLDNL